MQKFGEDLADALIALGLARPPGRPEPSNGWLDVEQRTAHLLHDLPGPRCSGISRSSTWLP